MLRLIRFCQYVKECSIKRNVFVREHSCIVLPAHLVSFFFFCLFNNNKDE